MSDQNIGIIVGSITTIVGTLIGAGVAYFFAIRLHNYTQKKTAGIALRSAFAEELYLLREEGDRDPSEFLKCAFKKHSLAIVEFATHLNKKEVEAFEKAWIGYYGIDVHSLDVEDNNGEDLPDNWKKYPFWEKYSKRTGSIDQAKERRQLAIENILKLQAFTQ